VGLGIKQKLCVFLSVCNCSSNSTKPGVFRDCYVTAIFVMKTLHRGVC